MFSKKVKLEKVGYTYITPNFYGSLRKPELYYSGYCIGLIQMNICLSKR
jgi:hypothetical protein